MRKVYSHLLDNCSRRSPNQLLKLRVNPKVMMELMELMPLMAPKALHQLPQPKFE